MKFRSLLIGSSIVLSSFCEAATMAIDGSITSARVNNSGPLNEPNDTTVTAARTTVTSTVTDWDIIIIDDNFEGFLAMFGSQKGSVFAQRRSGGGNISSSVVGSNVTSSLTFDLGVGDSYDYSFVLDYEMIARQGFSGTSVTWKLTNLDTGIDVFVGSDTSASGNTESTGTLSGVLDQAGTYELVITANLTDSSVSPNSNGSAAFEAISFEVIRPVPEPSSALLFGIGLMTALSIRKRTSSKP